MRSAGPEPTRYRAPLILLALAAGALVLLSHLFAQRFGVGDIYPRYSSLRTDGLGVKVIADSLEKAGYAVSRNYKKASDVLPGPASTLLLVGISLGDVAARMQAEPGTSAPRALAAGSRVVVTLLPEPAGGKDESPAAAAAQDGEKDRENREEGCGQAAAGEEAAEQVLALSLGRFAAQGQKGRGFSAAAQGKIAGREIRIPWYSPHYFTGLPPEWRVILAVHGQPVLVERAWGQATLAVAADSHFLSNAAILQDRDAYLLTWLLGGNKAVVFDEAHHGIIHRVSLMRLIRDVNLHWVLIGLMVPTLLFVLRCSSPLLPPQAMAGPEKGDRAGRDQFAGLVNILRRHPPPDLLQVCVTAWCKANRAWCEQHPDQAAEIHHLASTAPPEELAARYKTIARLLRRVHPSTTTGKTGTDHE